MLSRLSPYPLWAVLSIWPVVWTYAALTSSNPRIIHILVHPTGEWAAWLLILTMMISPLALIFRQSRVIAWLRCNRRYFGVASFGYALMHVIFYVLDKSSIDTMVDELARTYIWTGWIAFLIFVPLAMTSMDLAVRKMGKHWKTLQRTTYAAAVFTLVHWAAIHDWGHWVPALVSFGPLIALEVYRIWYWTNKAMMRRSSAA